MALPTLYCKTGTGKIQQWNIYPLEEDGNVFLITEYGEKDGKIIKRKSQIKTTKAKRSFLEEAVKQAETKFNMKVKKEGYTPNIEDANTTVVVRPMLANKFNPMKHNVNFPCLGEPKCDGNRGIVYMKDGEVAIESRSGTPIFYFDHIRQEVTHLLQKMPKGFYLDGEVFTLDLPFNVINGLCNRTPPTTKLTPKRIEKHQRAEELSKKVKYYIFDCFDVKNLSMPQIDRKELLRQLFAKNKYKNLVFVESRELYDVDDVKKYHDLYVEEGYEGIILRSFAGTYELKKRSRNLQKYKEFEDDEFIVVGYEEDKEDGVVWICETNVTPKSKFNVRPKCDAEYRKYLLVNAEKYMGAKLIVMYQEFTDDTHGIPRFPVGKGFRNIKDLD